MAGMLFLSAFTFTSCSQEENVEGVENNKSEIIANENVTRAKAAIDAYNEAINGIDGEQLAKAINDIEEADDESFIIPSTKDKIVSLLKNLPFLTAKVTTDEKRNDFEWENAAKTLSIFAQIKHEIAKGIDDEGVFTNKSRETFGIIKFISKDGTQYDIDITNEASTFNDADTNNKRHFVSINIMKDNADFLLIAGSLDKDYVYDPIVDKKSFGSIILNHTKDIQNDMVVKYNGITIKNCINIMAKREVNINTKLYKDEELMVDLNAKLCRSNISLFDHTLEAHVSLSLMDGMIALDLNALDIAKLTANALNAHVIDQTRGRSLEKCTKIADELNELTKLNIQMGGEDFGKLTFGVRPCDCTCTNVECKCELGTCTCGCGKYYQVVQLIEIPAMFNNALTFAEVQKFFGIDIKELIQGIINGGDTGDDGDL